MSAKSQMFSSVTKAVFKTPSLAVASNPISVIKIETGLYLCLKLYWVLFVLKF